MVVVSFLPRRGSTFRLRVDMSVRWLRGARKAGGEHHTYALGKMHPWMWVATDRTSVGHEFPGWPWSGWVTSIAWAWGHICTFGTVKTESLPYTWVTLSGQRCLEMDDPTLGPRVAHLVNGETC